jgi:hypothetical protein
MRGHGWRRGTSRLLELLLAGALLLALGPAVAQASVSVSDASVTETNAGGAVATFTVTRTIGLFTGAVDVGFATADGSAHAPGDYAALFGTLHFGSAILGGPPQVQEIPVPIVGDALDEPAETFRMLLSGSDEIADGEGVATITDNDPPPVVSVADADAAPEGATATFTIALSAPSGRDVSVGYGTVDGSAVAGQDYAETSGTATIPAGATRTTVGVGLLDDADDEPTETFALALGAAVNATRGAATATATILDTDEPAPTPPPAPPAANANSVAGSSGASPPPSPHAIGPPTSATTNALPQLGISSPRLRRPSTVLITVSCPRSASLCDGQVTIYSRPNARSKLKVLRKERRLGARLFRLKPGTTRTLQIALRKTDRVLLLRTGRMNVRAFAVTEDAAGQSGVRRVTGTLIARTTHS